VAHSKIVVNQRRNEQFPRYQLGHHLAFTNSDTAGEVPMIGLITDELTKRREKISPFRLMQAPGEARFSRPFDFASSLHEESSAPRMKIAQAIITSVPHAPWGTKGHENGS
jgi:hypothetical protein